jgi:membrane protein EpsK
MGHRSSEIRRPQLTIPLKINHFMQACRNDTVNQVGVLLFMRTDVWVCNRFIGAEEAGEYAAILQWPQLIRLGSAVIGGILAPMIMIYYARGEMDNLIRLSRLSVRLFSSALAIPISVLCVFSPQILRLWLGESFTDLAPLMVVMLFHLAISQSVAPLFAAKTALNKVRFPGIVTLVGGITNLILAILFCKYLNWGLLGVAAAGAFVLTVNNAFFVPVYAAKILGKPWHIFVKAYVPGGVILLGLTGLGLGIKWCLGPMSLSQFAMTSLVIVAIGLGISWLSLPKSDRRVLYSLIPKPSSCNALGLWRQSN